MRRGKSVIRKGILSMTAVLCLTMTRGAVVKAEPEGEQVDPEEWISSGLLEKLQNYQKGDTIPSVLSPEWNTYGVNENAVIPYLQLPEKYDLRTDHVSSPVPAIRNQEERNTCWAFSSVAGIESNAVIRGAADASSIDYSELFHAWFAFEPYEGEGLEVMDDSADKRLYLAGNALFVLADTAAWMGPVEESLLPYQNQEVSGALRDQVPEADTVHVQNMDILPETAIFEDWENGTGYSLDKNALNAVKESVMENGMVSVLYYAGYMLPEENGGYQILNPYTYAHYCPVYMGTNHLVDIVGWDDNYSADNFAVTPEDEEGNPLDGAWIVRNSWGTGAEEGQPGLVDQDGYFYISYYDQSVTTFTSFQTDVKDAEGKFEYDHNYQYDYLGTKNLITLGLENEAYGSRVANVFEAGGTENLEAVSAMTVTPGSQVKIEIYKLEDQAENPQDGELILEQTETVRYAGYHTITLSNELPLTAGEKFSVVEQITAGNSGYLPIEMGVQEPIPLAGAQIRMTAKAEEGESYWGSPDGDGTYVWKDLSLEDPVSLDGFTAEYGNAMIKAFTSDREISSDGLVTVDILHTNDVHGRSGYQEDSVVGFDKLAALIDQNQPDLVVDAGDLYHGQAFATLEQGESIAQLVKTVGYDLMTPGNHDWNYGKDRLKELAGLSGVTMLAGNITENGQNFFGNEGTFVKEITDEDGDTIKVGVLAVFDPDIAGDTAPSNIQGLDFADDAETATALAAKLREEGCDLVVALSHQLDCKAFLSKTSGIDVLIAGHEHTILKENYPDADGKEVPVVETGAYYANVGQLTLTYHVAEKITEVSETLITAADVAELEPDQEVSDLLTQINERQQQQLTQVVGAVSQDLDGQWESLRVKETGMGRLVAAAYLDETGADVAFENAGGIRIGRILKAGDITYGDVIDTAPFGNYIVTKEITGEALLSVLEQSIEVGRLNRISYDEWIKTGSDQVSWPDNSGSYLQFAGISVKYDITKPAGQRVISAQVGSEKLDREKFYTIATNNFVALGDDYLQLKDVPEIHQFGACDEALIRFLQKGQEMTDAAVNCIWLQETADQDKEEAGPEDNKKDEDGMDHLPDIVITEIPEKTNEKQDAAVLKPQETGAQAESETVSGEAADTGEESMPALWWMLFIISGGICIMRSAAERRTKI